MAESEQKRHLVAWRTTGKNPSEDPPVSITIAPREKGSGVWPWIIPLVRAVEMFGQGVVDQIGEEPVPVTLNLSFGRNTSSTPTP